MDKINNWLYSLILLSLIILNDFNYFRIEKMVKAPEKIIRNFGDNSVVWWIKSNLKVLFYDSDVKEEHQKIASQECLVVRKW